MKELLQTGSGACVLAERAGVVSYVDSEKVLVSFIKDEKIFVDVYDFKKYTRSNQNTCINQKPIVKLGDSVEVGDVIADSSSIQLGELALGQNMRVAFMPWYGYNFEDSIIISERVVKDDRFYKYPYSRINLYGKRY